MRLASACLPSSKKQRWLRLLDRSFRLAPTHLPADSPATIVAAVMMTMSSVCGTMGGVTSKHIACLGDGYAKI